MIIFFIRLVAVVVCLFTLVDANSHRKSCVVKGAGSKDIDDAPAIMKAFKDCGQHGNILFKPITYHVNSAMNVSWLEDVDIEIHGTLEVCGPTQEF